MTYRRDRFGEQKWPIHHSQNQTNGCTEGSSVPSGNLILNNPRKRLEIWRVMSRYFHHQVWSSKHIQAVVGDAWAGALWSEASPFWKGLLLLGLAPITLSCNTTFWYDILCIELSPQWRTYCFTYDELMNLMVHCASANSNCEISHWSQALTSNVDIENRALWKKGSKASEFHVLVEYACCSVRCSSSQILLSWGNTNVRSKHRSKHFDCIPAGTIYCITAFGPTNLIMYIICFWPECQSFIL